MSFLKTDDDDLDFAGGSSKLANLFGTDNHVADQGNQSLTYTAPKQPKKDPVKQPEKSQAGAALACLHANPVSAFKLVNGQYESQGKVGAAVLGSHENNVYNLILYRGKQQHLAMVSLSESFRFTVQPNNYANFYDNQKQNWSVLFDTSEACCNFAKHIALAVANSAGSNQLKKVIVQDLIPGEGNELGVDDSAEIKYTGWFLTNYTFGKIFDTNKNTDKYFRVRLGKGKVIKGWEDGLIGAKKNGRRILIIPPNLGYGVQGMGEIIPPNSILIFEIDVNKVKIGRDRSDSRSATPQLPDLDPTADAKQEAKPTIASKPRTSSARNVDNIRSRAESITEQLSSSPKTNKAKLISRMAKMGQPMIPLDGAIPVQPSDESGEEVEETNTSESSAPQIISQPSPKKEPTPTKNESFPTKRTAQFSNNQNEWQDHYHTKPIVNHHELKGVTVTDAPLKQLAVYPPSNPYAQHPSMLVGSSMGYPNTPFAQPTLVPPQYLPIQQVQPPAASSSDGHTTLLLSETRSQNTEVRLNISKLCDKVDLVMSMLNEMKASSSSRIMPSGGYSVLEPTTLLHSITKMVQENTALKQELEEKRSKLESQSEKISELLHRNQRFIEQSNDMFERKNDSLQSTALESQARVFTLEKEKNALSYKLSDALSKLSYVQQELASKQGSELALMSKLDNNSSSSLRNAHQLTEMQTKVADAERTIGDLQQLLSSEKQGNGEFARKISELQNNVIDLRSKNSVLENSLTDQKRKIIEQSTEHRQQIAQLEASHSEEVQNLKSKQRKPSASPTSTELQELEETLNIQWQEKCDKLLSTAEIRHKQRMNDEQRELLMKVGDLKQKLQEAASNSGHDEELKRLQSEVENLSKWKTKYENLHASVMKMKQNYEEKIEELEHSPSEDNQDTVAEVKKVMNAVFKQLQEKVDQEDSYTGAELLQTVLGVIRETTIQYLQKNQMKKEQSENALTKTPDENDSERGLDEVDEWSQSGTFDKNEFTEEHSPKDHSSEQESPSETPEPKDIPENSQTINSIAKDEDKVSIACESRHETTSVVPNDSTEHSSESEQVDNATPSVMNKSPNTSSNPEAEKQGEEDLERAWHENKNELTSQKGCILDFLNSHDVPANKAEKVTPTSEHSHQSNKEFSATKDTVSGVKIADVKKPIPAKAPSSLDEDLKPVPPPLWSDDEDDDADAWLC